MKPPDTLNVIDGHGGFTCLTRTAGYDRDANGIGWKLSRRERGETLWRPGAVLTNGTMGTLEEYDECSFFQLNNNATRAIYKVPHYSYRVAVWFDNVTGERIA